MSLLVWLPLHDGILTNLGMSPAKFSLSSDAGSNIISNASGKTGQYSYARSAINTAGCISSDIDFYFPNNFSMACWCKVNTVANTDTANGIITHHDHATGGGGITLKVVDNSTCYISANAGINQNSRYYNHKYGTTNIYGAWHHLALTYNRATTTYRLYVDGVEDCTFEYDDTPCARPFQLFAWSTSYTAASCKPALQLNDVRLWDECLSPTEIKLVSQGLFAHYPLRAESTYAVDCSGYGHNLQAQGTISSGGSTDSGRNENCTIFANG